MRQLLCDQLPNCSSGENLLQAWVDHQLFATSMFEKGTHGGCEEIEGNEEDFIAQVLFFSVTLQTAMENCYGEVVAASSAILLCQSSNQCQQFHCQCRTENTPFNIFFDYIFLSS